MFRIALDAMGSDKAPQVEVEGAAQAIKELPPDFVVQLVGRKADIEAALARVPGVDPKRVEIVDAPEVVGMGDKPLAAIRGKPRSSIAVGLDLQKKHKSDAFISAGNTGAVMAASTLLLRLHAGVQRAAIGALFPSAGQPVLVVDGGANVDVDAREIVGFAHLGSVYARDVLGRQNPTVGLLNIGEEDEKGNAVVKEAHQLLKQTTGMNYIGNVEGRDIPVGEARGQRLDVVACDGFVGNVVLKFYESAGRVFVALIKREAPDVLQRPEMTNVLNVLDYATYGGAPLLGVQGRRDHLSRRVPGEGDQERHPRRRPIGPQPSLRRHRRRVRRGQGARMKRPFAELWGTGSYAPPRVMTNDEFSKILDTSDQWIQERTGIRERRVSTKEETNACMGKAAALQVLAETGLTPLDVDAIIYATASPDRLLPSQACDLQAMLGAKNAAAFDVGAACSGFIYALTTAEGHHRRRAGRTRARDRGREAHEHHGLERPHDRGVVRRRRRRDDRAQEHQRAGHSVDVPEVGRHAGRAAVPARRRRHPSAERRAAEGPQLLHQDGGPRSLQGRRAVHGGRLRPRARARRN